MTCTTSSTGEENVSRFSDFVKFPDFTKLGFSATCPLCLGIVCIQITPRGNWHNYDVEQNPYYYHTKTHALGLHLFHGIKDQTCNKSEYVNSIKYPNGKTNFTTGFLGRFYPKIIYNIYALTWSKWPQTRKENLLETYIVNSASSHVHITICTPT